jgi:RNA polymerase sigma-70 factor (ECF subfamily)
MRTFEEPHSTPTSLRSKDAMVDVIESCRSYLLLVADRRMSPELKAKEGASDMVQEAMAEAHRRAGKWEGGPEATNELRAWLRRFLNHKIAHAARKYRGTERRRAGRELRLEAVDDNPGLAETLVAPQTSIGTRASRREEQKALIEALERLPGRMRRAVLWRHTEGCTFDELGRRLGCSNVAARNLWLRALQQLQDELAGRGHGAS